jgi:hypothetical protein
MRRKPMTNQRDQLALANALPSGHRHPGIPSTTFHTSGMEQTPYPPEPLPLNKAARWLCVPAHWLREETALRHSRGPQPDRVRGVWRDRRGRRRDPVHAEQRPGHGRHAHRLRHHTTRSPCATIVRRRSQSVQCRPVLPRDHGSGGKPHRCTRPTQRLPVITPRPSQRFTRPRSRTA